MYYMCSMYMYMTYVCMYMYVLIEKDKRVKEFSFYLEDIVRCFLMCGVGWYVWYT